MVGRYPVSTNATGGPDVLGGCINRQMLRHGKPLWALEKRSEGRRVALGSHSTQLFSKVGRRSHSLLSLTSLVQHKTSFVSELVGGQVERYACSIETYASCHAPPLATVEISLACQSTYLSSWMEMD